MEINITSKKEQESSCSWLSWCCFRRAFSPTPREAAVDDQKRVLMVESNHKKPGGWKSMPYVIGNETFERLAAFGLLANFMVYLRREYHMDQVGATNIINIYSGFANFAPLVGALVSDAYIGRFWAIAIGSVASFLGMVAMTLTSCIPALKPEWCTYNDQKDEQLQSHLLDLCAKPSKPQLGFLVLSLSLLTIGTGGIRPNSIPFGVDQFDHTSEEGRRGINSYYNWYYTTFTVVVMITLTVVVYIQDSVSWVWGFGIPTALMFCSIVLFIFGTRLYVYIKPEGSVFSNISFVFVAAYKKRHLELPHVVKDGVFYDPPVTGVLDTKLHLTDQFSFLNKAAIILEGETNLDGIPKQESKWTLCSIQHIEEVKCLIRVLPIWASGIICFTAAAQTSTFTVSQAMIMNRHIGLKNFKIPPGTIIIVSMIAVGVWVPIYDRLVVPALRKATKLEEGITLLQRMGIGLVLSIIAMVIAGLVEQRRRGFANFRHETMSVVWLVPQLVMLGLAEAFNFIGQIEFYNKQFPENLRSMATSLFFCTIAGANYLSTGLVSLVHGVTGTRHRPDWLTDDLNQGRVDYFYYLLAILGVFNMVYFLFCAKRYRYKETVQRGGPDFDDIELDVVKH